VSEDQKRSSTTPHIAPGSRRARTRRFLHLLLLMIAVVVLVDAIVGEGGMVVRQRRRREYNQLVSELDRLKSANDLMRDKNRRLRDDPSALEEAARRDLGLMKPGETVFIVKDHRDRREPGDHPSSSPP